MNLGGELGELRFVVEVTRKDTGAVETYDIVGKIMPEDDGEPVEPKKEVE